VQPAQVVPQEEQVEQVCAAVFTQLPLYMVQLHEAAAAAEEPLAECS
jgi:hypothetical protein